MIKYIANKSGWRGFGALILCLALILGQAPGVLAASDSGGHGGQSFQAAQAIIDTADQLAADEEKKELFTLEQIAGLARSRGAETLSAKAALATAQAAKDAADMAVYNSIGDAKVGAMTAQEEAIMALDDAKATVEIQMEVSIHTAEGLYFTYLQLQDALVLLDKSIELSREQVRIAELKLQIGLGTATEVQTQALAYDEALDQKQEMLNNMDTVGRRLMRQIGRDADQTFRLDRNFSIEGLTTAYDPEQLADMAVRNSIALGVMSRAIDKLADAMDYGIAPSVRDGLAASRDDLILTRDNTIQSLRVLARSTATGLDTARLNMSLLEKKIADKKLAYDTLVMQVSLGLEPRLRLQGAELELLTAENELLKARQEYYLSLRAASLLVKGVTVAGGQASGAGVASAAS